MFIFTSALALVLAAPIAAVTWTQSIAEGVAACAAVLGVVATLLIAGALQRNGKRQRKEDHDTARRQAMTDAHIRLTTGEVATARHLVGILKHESRSKQLRLISKNRADYIQAFYTLAWTVESISNLRKTWTSGTSDGTESDFLKWNEAALHENIGYLRAVLTLTDSSFHEESRQAWRSVQRARA